MSHLRIFVSSMHTESLPRQKRRVSRACVRECLTLAGVEQWTAERRRARSRPRGLLGCGVGRRVAGCMYAPASKPYSQKRMMLPSAEKRTSAASTLHLRPSHSRLRRGSTCVSVLASRECLQNCIVGVRMLSGLRGSYGHVGRKKVPRCVYKSFSHRNERISSIWTPLPRRPLSSLRAYVFCMDSTRCYRASGRDTNQE